jgi:hypothetical protein
MGKQLSKASTLALISMCVILITVVTQGARVPPESKGDFRGLLFVSDGFFQAVSVISFGMLIAFPQYSPDFSWLLLLTGLFQHLYATTTLS